MRDIVIPRNTLMRSEPDMVEIEDEETMLRPLRKFDYRGSWITVEMLFDLEEDEGVRLSHEAIPSMQPIECRYIGRQMHYGSDPVPNTSTFYAPAGPSTLQAR